MKKPLYAAAGALLVALLASARRSDAAQHARGTKKTILADTTWNSGDDVSQIEFAADGTFRYYRYKEDHSDSYYTGTYQFTQGKDAISTITGPLALYHVAIGELYNVIARSPQYTVDNFVCLILNNRTCMVEGENTLPHPQQTPYFGFLLKDGTYLDLANMRSREYHGFVRIAS